MHDNLPLVKDNNRSGRKLKSNGLPGLLPAMEHAGLDDTKLAELLGKTSRTIQSWRLGDGAPQTPAAWLQLADALNTTVDKLMSG